VLDDADHLEDAEAAAIIKCVLGQSHSSNLHDYISIAASALHEFMRFGNPVERKVHGNVVLKSILGEK
jgi:hypothetical protein